MQVSKVCRRLFTTNINHIYCEENGKERHNMNETLYDLEQKRNAVELDIQALYETLQQEIKENKKDVRE